MKILQIYKDFYPPIVGGIEGHINVLSKGLNKNGISVTVLVSNTNKGMIRECIDGIKVIKAPEFGRISSAPINPTFPQLLNELAKDSDLLHFHLPNPTSVISYLSCGIKRPIIITYHSDIVRQEKLYFLYKPLEELFFPKIDRIIATSPNYIETSNILKKYKDKCSVIPLGVSIERFTSVNLIDVEKVKQIYKKPIVLFIGKFRYYKGLHLLLEAMKKVDALLVVIGNGDSKIQYNCFCKDKIVFLGEVDDETVNLYLNACDLLVLPSVLRSEAYGLVLIEAMACGKAVISTELGTGTSFVNINGETGLVVPANSANELTKAINKLLNDPDLRQKLGSNGKERVKKYFTDDKMVSDTIKLYENVLNRIPYTNKYRSTVQNEKRYICDSHTKKNLLFINQYYPPDRSATASILERIVEYLSNYFNITVLAGRPSYLSKERHSWKPIYFFQSMATKIIRVGSFAYPRKNLFFRSLNYISFFVFAFIAAIITRSEKIIAMTDPPLSGIIGAAASKIKKKPFIYYIQDLHPEMAIASGMIKKGSISKMWDKIHSIVLQKADKIFVIGDDMLDRIINKGICRDKIIIVRHGAARYGKTSYDEQLIKKIRGRYLFTFVHAGNIGFYGAWESIVKAVKKLHDNSIGFIFVGEGQNKKMLMEMSKSCSNIAFIPFQPREKVKSVLESGDIHIITIKRGLEGLVVPSKIYPLLSAHKPILAVCPASSDLARIIRRFNCGLVADPDSPHQIAEAINQFYLNRNNLSKFCENSKRAAEYYDQEGQLNILKNEIEKTRLSS